MLLCMFGSAIVIFGRLDGYAIVKASNRVLFQRLLVTFPMDDGTRSTCSKHICVLMTYYLIFRQEKYDSYVSFGKGFNLFVLHSLGIIQYGLYCICDE